MLSMANINTFLVGVVALGFKQFIYIYLLHNESLLYTYTYIHTYVCKYLCFIAKNQSLVKFCTYTYVLRQYTNRPSVSRRPSLFPSHSDQLTVNLLNKFQFISFRHFFVLSFTTLLFDRTFPFDRFARSIYRSLLFSHLFSQIVKKETFWIITTAKTIWRFGVWWWVLNKFTYPHIIRVCVCVCDQRILQNKDILNAFNKKYTRPALSDSRLNAEHNIVMSNHICIRGVWLNINYLNHTMETFWL